MGFSYQKGFGWPHLIFTLVLIFVLAGILTPLVIRHLHGRSNPEALNNAKAIASGLVTFKEEYGTYPCPETREVLRKIDDDVFGSYDDLFRIRDADDANTYLSQLIVTDIIDSETYFYAAGVKRTFKGDDLIGTPDKLLSKGENSFAYLMAPGKKPLTKVRSITPLVMASIISSNDGVPLFDPFPYSGYYIYGAADGSGKQGKIGPTGLPLSKGRTHLFQPGPDSPFGDQVPVVKYPLGF